MCGSSWFCVSVVVQVGSWCITSEGLSVAKLQFLYYCIRIFFSCCSFNGINYRQPNGLFNLWHDCHSKECNCSINRWVILFMFSAVVNLLSCRAIDRPEWLNYACTFLHQLESRIGGAKPGEKKLLWRKSWSIHIGYIV